MLVHVILNARIHGTHIYVGALQHLSVSHVFVPLMPGIINILVICVYVMCYALYMVRIKVLYITCILLPGMFLNTDILTSTVKSQL